MKIIDVHAYYGYWPWPIRTMGIADIISLMKELNIEKTVMVSSRAISHDFVRGNRELASAISDRANLYGYVYINANYPERSLKEMEKYLNRSDFPGVKFHPEYSRSRVNAGENDMFFDVLENEYAKALLVHTWSLAEHNNVVPFSLPEYVVDLAKRRPKLKIIMGHMGGPGWREAVDLSVGVDNVWLDIATSYSHYDKIEYAVKRLGVSRVVFGTAMTENNPSVQIGAVLEANISDSDRERIFYKNAEELFFT